MRLLLLGGTAEARALAAVLVEDGVEVVSSLAGRVQHPRLPAGAVRVGGFGGVEGLAAHLRAEHVDAVVDATHPFAATISGNSAAACRLTNVPLLRLARPGWSGLPGANGWRWVDDHDQAARTVATLGSRVFLTTGRRSLDAFTGPLAGHDVLVRVVDPLERGTVPSGWQVLLDRGPYAEAGERALMAAHGTEVLVTKDSGGDLTRAKLDAARSLHVEVVVVRRPPVPTGVETVSDVAEAVRWTRRRG
jgi:precorrin-6A/cobalt-precorrin-6A reductase